ncbi:MAG: response regulator [Desulfobacteraceae bacterium]|jgi:DNA-binding NtrC family response regulator
MHEQEYPAMNADGIRLLLVDDDINLLELTSQLLFRKGYLVTPVTGSSEAITILNINHGAYDVVVTDLCMPENNGIELAIMIKTISADIPVILHTGKIDLIDERQIALAGIAEVITKPYRVEELDKIIKKVLKKQEA